ncbi:MAG TPA: hypothetical protein VIU61_05345 [Kofleriaceae bacterium]
MKSLIPMLAFLVACGGGDDGEPIDGTVVITVGSNTITPNVGAALVDADDPNDMVVIVGTSGVNCSTNFDEAPLEGTAFFATVPQTVGTTETFGWVSRSSSGSLSLNGSSATVIIDGLGDRVTGSVVFDTIDEDDGEITVSGTFDVISCL